MDVTLEDGHVTALHDAEDRPVGAVEFDLTGFLLLESGAEPHVHLDKVMSWNDIRPPMGDLSMAITPWRAYASGISSDSIASRAKRGALALLANGTTAVRSHTDLLPGDDPLRGVRALAKVRSELASVMDIQLVAMASDSLPDEVIDAALDLGVDFVGGAPHLASQPSEDLQRILRVAQRRLVGVDIHMDEQLDPNSLTLEELAISVRNWPDSMSVTAGHCVSLGTMGPGVRDRFITEVVASKVGIVSLPITNLYLQGWKNPVSMPRGLPPSGHCSTLVRAWLLGQTTCKTRSTHSGEATSSRPRCFLSRQDI